MHPLLGVVGELALSPECTNAASDETEISSMTEPKQPKSKSAHPPVAFDPVEAALRQIFNDVAAEEIPDDFAALVAQLDPKSGEKKEK